MKKIIAFTIPLLVVSCGGGVDNPPVNNPVKINCEKNVASTAMSNSIQLTVQNELTNKPLEGVVVQIDQKGKCIFSGADGKVNFDGLTAAPHDIHVFGQNGFGWKSFYDLPVSDVTVLTLPVINLKNPAEDVVVVAPPGAVKSYLLFNGAVEFSETNSQISFNYFTDIPHTILEESEAVIDTKRSYALRYQFNKGIDTVVNDELWAFESIDVNGDTQLVDAALVSALNHKTTAEKDSTGKLNATVLPITLSLTKRKFNKLMKINSLTLPTGFTFKQLTISAILTSKALGSSRFVRVKASNNLYATSQYDLATPRTFEAYLTPFGVNQTKLDINARAGNNASWRYVGNVPVSTGLVTTITFTPQLATVPSLFEPIGDTFKWSSVSNVVLQQNQIQILGGTGTSQKRWNIETSRASSSVTLPTLPAGLVPLLVKGNSYTVSLLGSYEYDAQVGVGRATESYSSFITWKR